jgi:hypothetical protein
MKHPQPKPDRKPAPPPPAPPKKRYTEEDMAECHVINDSFLTKKQQEEVMKYHDSKYDKLGIITIKL